MNERSQPTATVRRGRLAALTALLVTAALAWLVAPALSTEPYAPGAVDFTMPIGAVAELDDGERGHDSGAEAFSAPGRDDDHRRGHGARNHPAHGAAAVHGPVRYRTPPLQAPGRFDLVGVAGGEGPYEYRVREDGEAWSDWFATDPGAPVYSGGSGWVQVRSRGVPISGELHFVNVSGDKSAAGGIVNRVRSAVNSAVISVLATQTADAAEARAKSGLRRPQFVSRREWGAKDRDGGCRPRTHPEYGKVKAGVVHHTVSTNSYSRAEAPRMVLAICRYHRNGNGWNDIGYNALVDRFGNIYQGRAGGMRRPVIGAHAEGVNSQTAGVSALGDFQHTRPPRRLVNGIVKYLAWRLGIEGINARGRTRLTSTSGGSQRTPEGERMRVPRIFEHGRTNYTECAGKYLNRRIRKIRHKVQGRIRRGKRRARKPARPDEPPEETIPTPGGVGEPASPQRGRPQAR